MKIVLLLSLFLSSLFTSSVITTEAFKPAPAINPKIQVAILLDVSNSMDGLIDQAKGQLWNMVSVLGKARSDGKPPKIEIALYEYGRNTNAAASGYVKQISPFTSDLDKLSKDLFALNTNGGDEYCGQVIYNSLSELQWETSNMNYKVIFIAGNENFLQGKLHYKQACELAKTKGVLVNTIYCGSRQQGIRENWKLGGECASGSFTNIDHNAKAPDIPTPYDTTLFRLNEELNATYIHYGSGGYERYADQASVDKSNFSMNKMAAAKRISVKGKTSLYNNASWDLIDGFRGDSSVLIKLDKSTLPKEYQNKTNAQLQQLIREKEENRTRLQKNVSEVSMAREKYITNAKLNGATADATLETAIERILRSQAKEFNIMFE